jgi:hypothetical protein
MHPVEKINQRSKDISHAVNIQKNGNRIFKKQMQHLEKHMAMSRTFFKQNINLPMGGKNYSRARVLSSGRSTKLSK